MLVDRRSSGRDRDEDTCFYVGDVFVYTLALCMPIFKKKIFPVMSVKMFQTFHGSSVTTMKSLELFSRNPSKDFFLKIGTLSAKLYSMRTQKWQDCFSSDLLIWASASFKCFGQT